MTLSGFQSTSTYIASPALEDSVNVAVTLEKPLLIRGEPGTGKTLLAEAIAARLDRPLLRWHIKSTTKAQDGLYVYDTVQRLNDSRFGEGDVSDISRYIKLGPLGEALSREDVVLLIDEIDKADIEFPNDLLHELDRMSFEILETAETVTATRRPVMVITSNAEKELPDAFLRRCIFHYIEFPDMELMKRIVAVHHPRLSEELLSQVLVRFYWIRDLEGMRKKPSTSELIDWIGALLKGGIDPELLSREIPFLGVLVKRESDLGVIEGGVRRLRGLRA